MKKASESGLLPRIAHWLLGDAWRTSLAAMAAALLYSAQAVPAIIDGTATSADWRRALFASLLFLIGRFSADVPRLPKEAKKPTEEESIR